MAKVAAGKAVVTKAAAGAKVESDPSALLSDLRSLVQSARQRLATAANATYTLLCWQIGRRLLRDNLQAGRAAYGKADPFATVSQELTTEFGAGFNYTALTRMARFAEWMTDEDSCDAVANIELEPLRRTAAHQGPAGPRLLRRDVPHRALGRSHPAAEDRRHAVPAHGAVEAAEGRHLGRNRQAA